MLKENVELLTKAYHDNYLKAMHTIYSVPYKTNPEAFTFENLANIQIYIIKLNQDYFNYNRLKYFVFFKKNANLSIEEIDLTNSINYANYHQYDYDYDFLEDLLTEKHDLDFRDLVYRTDITNIEDRLYSKQNKEIIHWINIQDANYYENMKDLLNRQLRDYKTHIEKPASYYAKNAHKYAYSALDLGEMIAKVNDEDFEYQLNQAIAAYDHSLYMASCACLGVCLETLCKILLKQNNVKIKDSDATMLDKLADRLRSEQIISRKFNGRLDVCYKIRNLSSHTSPGVVIKEDCHIIIGTMREIVNTYID